MRRGRGGKPKPTAREARELEAFEALRAVLESRGWTVTLSKTLDGPGGDCIVRGARRVIVSSRLRPSDRVELLRDALEKEDLDAAELSPAVRGLLGPSRAAGPSPS